MNIELNDKIKEKVIRLAYQEKKTPNEIVLLAIEKLYRKIFRKHNPL